MMTAIELISAYRSGAFSPVAVVEATLASIASSELNAFWRVDGVGAREAARSAERAYRSGTARALEGVPVGVKDIFDTKGIETTSGSSILAGRVPLTDADAVRALRDAGAVIVGKTATHEFAFGVTTVNPHYGTTQHPTVPGHIVGGSSGGSAAAVAAGLVPLALGSDTSVSIREPSAFCGCVGLRPTHDSVSLRGVMPLAPSFDVVGPIARTPSDAALMAEVLWTGSPGLVGAPPTPSPSRPLRIAVMPSGWSFNPIPEIATAVDRTTTALAQFGHVVSGVEIVELLRGPEIFTNVMLPEGWETHRRLGLWPERESEYGPDVAARLRLAETITLEQHLRAVADRRDLQQRMHTFFSDFDVLLTPTSAVAAPTIEHADSPDYMGSRYTMRDLVFPFLVPAPLCGLPSLAIPAGTCADGLPISVLLTAAPGNDRLLLHVGTQLLEGNQ